MKKVLLTLLAALLITWGIWMALHMGFWSLFVLILAVFFIFPAIRRSEKRDEIAKEEARRDKPAKAEQGGLVVVEPDPETGLLSVYNPRTGERRFPDEVFPRQTQQGNGPQAN
jgi:Na+-transporting methylmalonyl-CoA/oxaloacetate decarboxylase gamma subunit